MEKIEEVTDEKEWEELKQIAKICEKYNYDCENCPMSEEHGEVQYGDSKPSKDEDEAFLNWVKDNLEVKK